MVHDAIPVSFTLPAWSWWIIAGSIVVAVYTVIFRYVMATERSPWLAALGTGLIALAINVFVQSVGEEPANVSQRAVVCNSILMGISALFLVACACDKSRDKKKRED